MKWLPIEDAPKDGSIVLTVGIAYGDFGYTSDERGIYLAHWESRSGAWSTHGAKPRYWQGYKPLFFIPIPAIPEIKV